MGFVETRQAQNVLYKQIDFSTCGPRTAGCGPLGFLFLHNDQHIEFECILTGMNFILFDTFKFVLWAPTRSGKLDGLRPGPASQVLRFGCGRILHDQVLEFVRRLGHVFINM